jgi:2-keto-4-pentenoate hydratase/2-oxohepta-3-ene-1,7-dioic acid hydratase in catechol pathway
VGRKDSSSPYSLVDRPTVVQRRLFHPLSNMAINGFVEGSLTNYISYVDPLSKKARIGHYDAATNSIQPLSFNSGTFITDLYQVIEVGESGIKASEDALPADSTKILAPITGRDILCVGKNYAEHAVEFNSSGFDSSDKVDQPTHPVIFTKRFSSIIAHGDEIYPHPEFSATVDYEGEIGVIIGKAGFRISEADAMDHVWGYTIVNDVTAREKQRDHKQFYLGKSPDTFCPMVQSHLAIRSSRR